MSNGVYPSKFDHRDKVNALELPVIFCHTGRMPFSEALNLIGSTEKAHINISL